MWIRLDFNGNLLDDGSFTACCDVTYSHDSSSNDGTRQVERNIQNLFQSKYHKT